VLDELELELKWVYPDHNHDDDSRPGLL